MTYLVRIESTRLVVTLPVRLVLAWIGAQWEEVFMAEQSLEWHGKPRTSSLNVQSVLPTNLFNGTL